ncbi:transcription factor Tos4 [Histoplasma capsulatum H143]|uniref:Transcription factor Tos4 n=1 Tax=Ajellomyces capsulatus (strain H143) TaxID=544712 RepID=C6HJX8_AJECH|nr:transcription factor Tos4 [Histoplasma capsulatum H143]
MELESSPPRADTLPLPIAGVKRPASLLPAFEPSSSPSLPRPYKRLARESGDDVSPYPTPVPTSSTAILTSSPPRRQAVRPGLKRTLSVASERAPLSTVPSIMLPLSGEPILMGRSSGSCHFQLTSDQTWEESSPVRKPGTTSHPLQASPLRSRGRLASPISPSPAVQALQPPEPPLLTPSRSVHSAVVVYEDEPSPTRQKDSKSTSQLTEVVSSPFHNENLRNSMSSSCDDKAEELSEHDEENDPIIHSFGPFGDNILPRMASFNTGMSPVRSPVNIRKPAVSPRQHTAASKPVKTEDDQHSLKQNVQNHVVNQLAFSRLSSTPLSTIISHLPPELWKKTPSGDGGFSSLEIKSIIGTIACIGEVSREGKDAAGKPLESEYYYIPDLDEDEKRKEAVVNDLMKPGLRSCRKQHKRYYWRKPK